MVPEKHLNRIALSIDVYAICIQHALTTEKQEIMGLLIGEIDETENVSHISACMILHRSDKQPDRVEISPEQLCGASAYAEQLATTLNRPMRVIGWYHSHPHITVWPSHVDIGTQATYQLMDPLFVGLIFSLYQNDSRLKHNQIQMTGFQSITEGGSKLERREVPVVLENSPYHLHNLQEIAGLAKILVQEEVECHTLKDNQTNNVIARLHNDAFKTQALAHIVSKVSIPMCDDVMERLNSTRLRIKSLQRRRAKLLSNKLKPNLSE